MNCTKDYFANYLSALGKGIFTQRVAKIAGDAGQGEKMTHDELLFKIYEIQNDSSDPGREANKQYKGMIQFMQALRAVVELHKPMQDKKLWCRGCRIEDDDWYSAEYPCETIQAIKKELG